NVPSNSEMTFESKITNGHPVTFDFIYNSERVLRSYGFRAGTDEQGRMPNSWKLFGTRDGKDWELLDVRKEPKAWAVDERREYRLQAAEQYTGYRVEIDGIGGGDTLRIYGFFLNFEK
ncbi:MAG: hypothetical protein J2P31_20950, partial [Blastocatellia bacterium]|nr:hypothetical protein [Blastocatellia bacterium]